MSLALPISFGIASSCESKCRVGGFLGFCFVSSPQAVVVLHCIEIHRLLVPQLFFRVCALLNVDFATLVSLRHGVHDVE